MCRSLIKFSCIGWAGENKALACRCRESGTAVKPFEGNVEPSLLHLQGPSVMPSA